MKKTTELEDVKPWRRYPIYKDSGIEWLREVPEHWEVCKLRRKLKDGSNGIKIGPFGSQLKLEYMKESGFKVYGQEHIIANDFSLGSKYVDATKFLELSACSIEAGDLLVTMMGSSGRCQIAPSNIKAGIMDSHLLRLRVKENHVLPGFISILIDKTLYVREQLKASGKGAIMHGLNSFLIKEIVIAIPPLSEQQAIAQFLDQETTKIDSLVAKKERLIELLKEKRTALISHVVTKGLNPNVPLKDSGIEWLGAIPEHWELHQLRRVVNKFVDYRGATPEKSSHGIPLITAKNIKNGIIDFSFSQEFIKEKNYDTWMVRGFPQTGDVLVTTEAPLGESAQIIDTKVALAQRIILLKAKNNVINDYLKYHFISDFGKSELLNKATGSTAIGIKAYHFKATFIVIPPLCEQQAIAQFLDQETTKIDTLVAKTQTSIEKLKEYRTALISAVVTGKIDIREEV